MSPYNCKKCALYLRQWIEFHAAPSYRSLGDIWRSASTRPNRFDLDSLLTLQKCAVNQMAGVSIKDLASDIYPAHFQAARAHANSPQPRRVGVYVLRYGGIATATLLVAE